MLLTGAPERLLPRDAHYQREHQVTSRAIIDEALRILLGSIKAE